MLLELRTGAALREAHTLELSAENTALKSTVKELTDRASTMAHEIRSLRQYVYAYAGGYVRASILAVLCE